MPGFTASGSTPAGSLPAATITENPGGDPVTLTRSQARTIKIGAASRAFTAPNPGYWDMTNSKKPVGLKDPNSTLDITFDWSDWLADIGGALIAQFEIIPGGGVVVASKPPAEAGKLATVVLAGGETGEAPITCRITTDTVPPLVEDRTVTLRLEER